MTRSNGRKTIFITGAASGMGRETAKPLLQARASVRRSAMRCQRPARPASALEEEIGSRNGFFRALDVTDRDAYRAVLAEMGEATGGTLDILFNNAGIGRGGPFDDMPWEDVMAVINVNLIGVLERNPFGAALAQGDL